MEKIVQFLQEKLRETGSRVPFDWEAAQTEATRSHSVWPFNSFERLLVHLVADGVVSLDEYEALREAYRLRNRYLPLFENLSPAAFGVKWAEQHVHDLVPELRVPSRDLDPRFQGEYDFYYNHIRIEVKASRAVERGSRKPFAQKALSSRSTASFSMNFQQLKPACCDIFLWIGVWTDEIRYWVLSSRAVADHPCFSKGQHRGNVGEGQLWLTEKNMGFFEAYRSSPSTLLRDIVLRHRW